MRILCRDDARDECDEKEKYSFVIECYLESEILVLCLSGLSSPIHKIIMLPPDNAVFAERSEGGHGYP